MGTNYQEAKTELLNSEAVLSQEYFEKHKCWLELGYCKLFQNDRKGARECFNKIAEANPRARWALVLIELLEGNNDAKPTYFQIRNFLEIDIDLFIKNAQADYVERIINCGDMFFTINPESYKFIARVLLNNDFPSVAMVFLKRGKENFYFDPELHYMMAICYFKENEKQFARQSLLKCLSIVPNYYPAKEMLKTL